MDDKLFGKSLLIINDRIKDEVTMLLNLWLEFQGVSYDGKFFTCSNSGVKNLYKSLSLIQYIGSYFIISTI